MWTLIFLSLHLFCCEATISGIRPRIWSVPRESSFPSAEEQKPGSETLYQVKLSEGGVLTTSIGSMQLNHSFALASMHVIMYSHVIRVFGSRAETSYALCSIENGRILAEQGAKIRCLIEGFLQSAATEKLFASHCILMPSTRPECVVHLDLSSIGFLDDRPLEIYVRYTATIIDATNRVNEDLAGLLIHRKMFLPSVYLLRVPEVQTVPLPENKGFLTVPSFVRENRFAVNLSLSRGLNSAQIKISGSFRIRSLELSAPTASNWGVQLQQMRPDEILLEIRNLWDIYSREDGQLDSVSELLLEGELSDMSNRLELRMLAPVDSAAIHVPIPQLVPAPSDMRVFALFQASEVLLLPWLPGSNYPPPRGLQVFGYVASERRLQDLTSRVFCRPAQTPVGDTVDRKSQSTCPPNLRTADESLERPGPGAPPIKGVWGTGTNQADQLVLGLKRFRNIAPNFLFGSTADWAWRAWIGPAHRVWTVTRLQLQTAKSALNKIDSWWFQRGDSCLPRYQQTPIQLSASIYTQGMGGERIFLPDVEKGGALMLDFTSLLPSNSLQVIPVDSFGAQQPAAEVIWTEEGPFLVGLHRGSVSLMFKQLDLKLSQTVAVSDEPVFVSRFLSECLKENATISGQLDSFPLKGSSLEQFDFNLPMLQRLHLTAQNYLVTSLISSARNHSLLQLDQNPQQQQRPGPQHRHFDACPLQRTVNSFLLSDNSIQPLHQLAPGIVRLQAPSNDQWVVWDPAQKPQGAAEIRLSGTTAWSSHPSCMGSFLLGSAAPIAAMDEALTLAQLEQKWHPVPLGSLTDLSLIDSGTDASIASTKFAIIFGAICAAALVIILIQCAIVLAIRKRKNVSGKQRLVLETVAPPGSECGYCGGSSLLRQATSNHTPSPLMMSSSMSRGGPTMAMAASQQMTYQMARSPNHSPSQIPLMYHSPAHSPAISMNWKPANMQLMEIMSNSSGSGPSQCRLQTFRATQKSPLEEQAGYTSGLGSAITTTCCEVCSDEGVDTASSSVKLPPAMPKQRSDMFAGLPGSESSDVLVSMMGALEDEMDWDELQLQLRQQQKADLLPPPNF